MSSNWSVMAVALATVFMLVSSVEAGNRNLSQRRGNGSCNRNNGNNAVQVNVNNGRRGFSNRRQNAVQVNVRN